MPGIALILVNDLIAVDCPENLELDIWQACMLKIDLS
jgi:hypothetical protein